MTATTRLTCAALLMAFTLLGAACGPGPTPSAQKLDAEAAEAAARGEKGDRMKNGESKDVQTAFGVVTVKKEADGKMTYTRKSSSK